LAKPAMKLRSRSAELTLTLS